MASYFPPLTSRKQPLRQSGYTAHTVERRLSDASLHDSIYIFPNPLSAPPSPTHDSGLSGHAEFTSPALSGRIRLPRTRNGRKSSTSPSPPTPLSPWEWDGRALEAPGDRLPLQPPYYDQLERPGRLRARINQRDAEPVQMYTAEQATANLDSHGHHHHPHAPGHIPLLSFFVSLLAVDDSTARLLSHPASDSALFACPISSDSDLEEVGGELHGVEKLLVRTGGARIIKDALKSERESAPCRPLLPVPLLGLWNTVTVLVENSGNVLREVLHR
ncbi:hypothetical protein FPV67DRAFT_762232 [Lyophyllum atratum]|nr:hypothetical protein FPV67DRAFT_762232 [Lyophyllum atratum]